MRSEHPFQQYSEACSKYQGGLVRSNRLAIANVVLYRRTIAEGVSFMKHIIRSAATAASITVSGLLGSAAPAYAY